LGTFGDMSAIGHFYNFDLRMCGGILGGHLGTFGDFMGLSPFVPLFPGDFLYLSVNFCRRSPCIFFIKKVHKMSPNGHGDV
jgi:hypothetical protein